MEANLKLIATVEHLVYCPRLCAFDDLYFDLCLGLPRSNFLLYSNSTCISDVMFSLGWARDHFAKIMI